MSLAHLLTGSNEVAEDLVQDCFARLLRRQEPPDNPAGYLRTSVINAVRSWQRRQIMERSRPPPVAPDVPPPEVETMRSALLALRPRQRAAIVLRFYEDLSEAEIATVLDCRPGTVKSLLARGLERLREEVPKDEA
ncbi:MAG: sigma-70 family RNA polymerase sigma factor [Actinomycetota bacterium]|nr:sigma-70 family RNA polymerase sigma factor [Actinomycetota bacterium]